MKFFNPTLYYKQE